MEATRGQARIHIETTRTQIGQQNARRTHARQIEALRYNKPLVVVGTPGRLADLNRTGTLQTHGTRMLVLDEVRPVFVSCFFFAVRGCELCCGTAVGWGVDGWAGRAFKGVWQKANGCCAVPGVGPQQRHASR